MGGAEYIASLLTGYTGERQGRGRHHPLREHGVPGRLDRHGAAALGRRRRVYDDGHRPTIEQQAEDVAAFLMWTAEPKMMARKEAGFSGVLHPRRCSSVLLYLTNKRIWAPIKRKARKADPAPDAIRGPRHRRGFFVRAAKARPTRVGR